MMPTRLIETDVAVVGGTVAGAAAALALSKRGKKPLLLGGISRRCDESAVLAADNAIDWLPDATLVGSFPDEELVVCCGGRLTAVRAAWIIVAPAARPWRRPIPGGELPAFTGPTQKSLRPGSRVLVTGAAITTDDIAELNCSGPAITTIRTMRGDELMRVAPHGSAWQCTLSWSTVIADLIVAVDGYIEASELTRLAGCAHAPGYRGLGLRCVRDAAMRSSIPRWLVAGEAGFGAEINTLQGRIAAQTTCGEGVSPQQHEALEQAIATDPYSKIADLLWNPAACPESAVICICEGVTCLQIRDALREGARGPEVKSRTRVGMGLCQGRNCEDAVWRLTAGAADRFTIRPPIEPLPLSVL